MASLSLFFARPILKAQKLREQRTCQGNYLGATGIFAIGSAMGHRLVRQNSLHPGISTMNQLEHVYLASVCFLASKNLLLTTYVWLDIAIARHRHDLCKLMFTPKFQLRQG